MQKKIIVLAIAAAFSAPAFADVTPYGVVDGVIANVSNKGLKSDLLAVSGGLASSRFGIKATEDLGDGMTAIAVLEYGLDTQQSDSIGNARQEMLAIAGGFGTVATGYLQTTAYDFAAKFDPTAGSLCSPLQNLTKGNFLIGNQGLAARAPRAIAYISPNLSGVTIAFNYSTALTPATGNLAVANTATTGLKTTATLLSATYAEGPLSVGGVYAKAVDTSSGGASNTEMALGGSFDFGVAKVLGTFQSGKASTATKSDKALSVSAVAPIGKGAVLVSVAKNTMAAVNSNGTGMTVGYLHSLSTTTTAYAAYSTVKNGSASQYSVANDLVGNLITAGGSSNMIGVGLNKKF